MAVLNGKSYTKKQLTEYAGNINQLAFVRRSTISEGNGDGVRVVDINNSVLDMTLLESRALDMMSLRYKGIPLNFLAKPGAVSVALADPIGSNFLRSTTAGMFYTCGLTNVGSAYGDDYFHGRIRFCPADKLSTIEKWQDDDYLLGISGEVRQNGVLCENLVLRRSITTKLGSKTLVVDDTVENDCFQSSPLMFMYHMTCGFPLIDENAKLYVPSDIVNKDSISEEVLKEQDSATPPSVGSFDGSFTHKVKCDNEGYTYAGIYNHGLCLGFYLKFKNDNLPYLLQWKNLQATDYTMGFMPSNCLGGGRQHEIDNGNLKEIGANESVSFGFELTVIDGAKELSQFIEKYEGCKYVK